MKLSDFEIRCGIYRIKNLKTGKIYIGQSNDIRSRIKNHIKNLTCGTHTNKGLQEDYDNCGLSIFDYDILFECDKNDLFELESKTIKEYYDKNIKLYNETDLQKIRGWVRRVYSTY